MAIVTTDDRHYKAIADVIREHIPDYSEDIFTPAEMPSYINEATGYHYSSGYDDGFAKGFDDGWFEGYSGGHADGVEDGITEGKQAEYDRFWDAIQANGTKKLYQGTFRDAGWTDEVFRPKYDIVPEGDYSTYQMFTGSGIKDLKGCLEQQGVKLDFSKLTSFDNAPFQWSLIETMPELNCSKCANVNMSYAYKLKSVDRIILKADGTATMNFTGCGSLENIEFGGVIGTATNFQACSKLTISSITSIINALSTTTSGLSVTLSKTAVNKAFATTEGGTDGSTSTEWATLANTKSNWTINLI